MSWKEKGKYWENDREGAVNQIRITPKGKLCIQAALFTCKVPISWPSQTWNCLTKLFFGDADSGNLRNLIPIERRWPCAIQLIHQLRDDGIQPPPPPGVVSRVRGKVGRNKNRKAWQVKAHLRAREITCPNTGFNHSWCHLHYEVMDEWGKGRVAVPSVYSEMIYITIILITIINIIIIIITIINIIIIIILMIIMLLLTLTSW